MLPNNQNEGNPEQPAGAAQQPTTPASPAQGQPLPDYVTALQGQIESLTTQIKGLQKGTDKQIGQVRGDIKRILELKEQGMNEQQIQRELYIDSLMSDQNTPAPQPPPNGNGQQPGQSLDVDSVVTSLQFEPNDPALAALKIKHGNSQEFLKAAADLRLSQLQSPKPTPATTPSMQGGAAGTGNDTQALINQLQEYQKQPTRYRAQIQEIKQKLEERDWQ